MADYDVVFQEVPGEVTLALNLSGCPCGCVGCHSPQLAEDIGEELTEELLDGLMVRYGAAVTCVALMGGDASPREVSDQAARIKARYGKKTAWYSGRQTLAPEVDLGTLDYLKLGPYVEARGALRSATTNQRFYRIVGGHEMEDITDVFWRK